jgi:hypothetical protein
MKFRKKPIIIEAEQWFHGKKVDGVIDVGNWKPFVETLEGNMVVTEGDWIITGVNGEKYPCKPDIFEKTYELVEIDDIKELIERSIDENLREGHLLIRNIKPYSI